MTRHDLPLPIGGLSTDRGVLNQPADTSRQLANMMPIDPTNRRKRPATRAGMEKAMVSLVNQAKPARAITTLSVNKKRTTFKERTAYNGGAQGQWRHRGTEREISRGVKADVWGNSYWLNGNADLMKRNSDGKQVWLLSFPVASSGQIVRAFDVVADGSLLFAGVSKGGSRKSSKLWCYQAQTNDEAPQLLWELEGTGYVQDCKYKDGRLHTIQDYPDTGRSALVIYRAASTVNPEIDTFNEAIPYPTSGLDVGPDGSSYIASPANLSRGADPRYPRASPERVHWTLEDLAQKDERVWAWYRADSTGFTVPEDGDDVFTWRDLSGNGRTLSTAWQLGKKAPKFVEDALNGHPGVRFTKDGNTGLSSPRNLGTWLQTNDDPQKCRTVFPSYAGADFAAFFVVRFNEQDDGVTVQTNSALWQQDFTLEASGATTSASSHVNFNWSETGTTLLADNGTITWTMGQGNGTPTGVIDRTKDAVQTQWDQGEGAVVLSMVTKPEQQNVTNATPTTPVVITTQSAHGLKDDDWVTTADIEGTTGANGDFEVNVLTATTFELVGSVGGGSYTISTGVVNLRRAEWRVNGTPYDWFCTNWSSAATAGWGYNEQTHIGFEGAAGNHFEGDILEMLVLRDYKDTGDGVRKVIGSPGYPVFGWDKDSDTELERIEGWLMWQYGVQHCLDDGTIDASSDMAPTPASTIYPHPFHLRRRFYGKNATFSTSGNTLTLSGAFADYTENLDAVTYPDTLEITAGTGVTLGTYNITSKTDDDELVLATSIGANATDVEFAFTGAPNGAFATTHEYTSAAPPDPAGRGTDIQKIWYRRGLTYGTILEKWGPGGAELKWNLISAGGVGYGVRVAEIDDDVINVWSVGPHNLFTAYARCLEDLGADYDADTGTNAWNLTGSAVTDRNWEYQYLRIDVDKFGTCYIPHYDPDSTNTGGVQSVLAIKKDGLTRNEYLLNENQQAHAVAVHPAIPEYEEDAVTQAEYIFVASRQEGTPADTTDDTHHKLSIVRRTLDAGAPPREVIDLAVAGGRLIRWDSGAPLDVTGTQTLAADSPWVDLLPFYSKVYILDGKNYLVYDPKESPGAGGTVSEWIPTSAGSLPRGAKLGMVWNGRIVLARFDDDPHLWLMTAKDDALNVDTSPPVVLTTQAITGPLSPAGKVPDVITALIPWQDDIGVMGCDHQIWLLRGDPMGGGRIDQVTANMGIAFGQRPYAIGDDEVLYFVNDRGQLCRWPIGGRPTAVSEGRVDGRFQEIDLSLYMPYLVYDRDARGVWVFQVPYTASHTAELEHYFFCDDAHSSQGPGSFWPQTFASKDLQPMCAYERNSDDPDDRKVIVGTNDGFLRQFSGSSADDDGTSILSDLVVGPLARSEAPVQGLYTAYECELAEELNGARLSVYVHDSAREPLGETVADELFEPGFDRIYEPARGSYVYLRLRSPHRFAVEGMAVDVEPAGMKRRVGT